jgi:hypothetical protein
VTKRERQSKEERRSQAKVILGCHRGPLLGRAQEARRATLFRFAYYFGWREYVRTQVQLLRFENEDDTRLAAAFLNDVTRALASDKLDGRWRAASCRDQSRDRASANRPPESCMNGLVFTLKGLTLAR